MATVKKNSQDIYNSLGDIAASGKENGYGSVVMGGVGFEKLPSQNLGGDTPDLNTVSTNTGAPSTPKGSAYSPYTWTPSASRGYNPKQYQYNPMTDNTKAGQEIGTDAEGLRGVSDRTQQRTQASQDYRQSDYVTQLQQQLQGVLDRKPGNYQSKYSQSLDGILEQIQNPNKFEYSFNGDEMFRQYADLYTQQGRQASMDAMGQAAGLTGGYGNSYAQNAGNQAYNQYLLSLYDRGSDLRAQAFNEWQAQRADDYNRLAAVQNADVIDYGRYRDEVGDWQTDRGYYTDAENQAYTRDYTQFANDRDYWNQQQQLENADWWNANQFNETMRQNDANRALSYQQANAENQYRYDNLAEQQEQFGANYEEGVRQYNENLAESIREFEKTSELDWAKLEEDRRQYDANLTEEQRQYDRNLAVNYVKQILAQGKMPSAALLIAAGLSKADAKKIKAELMSGGGGGSTTSGSSGKKTPKKTTDTDPNAKNTVSEGTETADDIEEMLRRQAAEAEQRRKALEEMERRRNAGISAV